VRPDFSRVFLCGIYGPYFNLVLVVLSGRFMVIVHDHASWEVMIPWKGINTTSSFYLILHLNPWNQDRLSIHQYLHLPLGSTFAILSHPLQPHHSCRLTTLTCFVIAISSVWQTIWHRHIHLIIRSECPEQAHNRHHLLAKESPSSFEALSDGASTSLFSTC
jgi:hypothetical protein